MIGTTFRQNRGEILIATGLAGITTVALFVLGVATASAAAAVATCPVPAACADQAAALGQLLTWTPGIHVVVTGMAALLGASLGGLTVAADIEGGTAVLAWSLAADRRRWLRDRVAVLSGALAAVLVPMSLASWFLGSSIPAGNGQLTLDFVAGAGQVLGVGALAFASSTLLGVALGRVIPTVVSATIATLLAAAVLGVLFAIWRLSGLVDVGTGDGLILVVNAIDGNGVAHSLVEAVADAERQGVPVSDLYRIVELGIPFAGLMAVMVREAVVYGTVAVALLAVASRGVVSRGPLP